ncbi:hypothetical protein COCMIDRAFT_25940 [Bipolaris oryzae ATCC 44560]|uniref:Uncharacterized protein n=1 Tax=Bipolaris oryzae ATCC 44560 TaxID=930090 RepID=W6ZEM5_COCMI|nr:uncharacterized protein COCMIDRAFT_25940 [Bipolaris oryzae ATCC 44560]EUC45964.1 hypothetical protein COCMIDRAFT_25940 [Bipolaris oryzae ATCC 44560]
MRHETDGRHDESGRHVLEVPQGERNLASPHVRRACERDIMCLPTPSRRPIHITRATRAAAVHGGVHAVGTPGLGGVGGPGCVVPFSPGQGRPGQARRRPCGRREAEEAAAAATPPPVPSQHVVVSIACTVRPYGHGELATSVAETDAMDHGLSVRVGQRAVERPDGLWMQSAGGCSGGPYPRARDAWVG